MINGFVTRKLMRRFRDSTEVKTDYTQGVLGGNETLTRSAGSIYYFNGSGILTATGDNVAAFTSNGLFIEGQATSLIAAADYRNFAVWTATGVTMVASTPTGIDGTTLTSGKNEIKEDATLGEHRELKAFTATTAAKQSQMIAVKRGTGTRHIQVRLNNAIDGNYGIVAYNLDTLAVIGSLTGSYSTAYVKGSYTIIELVATNVTTGAQNFIVNMHNGTTNSYTGDNTATLILDWAQVVTSGRAESHVQGGATRYPSFINRPWIGAVNNFWAYVDMYTKHDRSGTSALIYRIACIFNSSTNHVELYFQDTTGVIRLKRRLSGIDTFATTAAIPYTRGDRLRCLLSIDNVNGMVVTINHSNTEYTASVASNTANVPALSTSGTKFNLLGYDPSFDRIPNGEVPIYNIGTGILTLNQRRAMVGL